MKKLQKLLVVIGSAKSGTTALVRHLDSRPDMVVGREKEPRYFTDFSDRTWTGPASEGFLDSMITSHEQYLENFEGIQDGQWAIDGSTDYIWSETTLPLLKKFSEYCDLRIICITRDPLDRAVSEYNHTLRHGWETLSFSDAIDAEEHRVKEGWQPLFYHQRRSTIHDDLYRFEDAFSDRLLILDYAEFKNTDGILRRVSSFLDIPHIPSIGMERHNQSFLPRNVIAAKLLNSPIASQAGKVLLPSSLRSSIWRRLHTNARNVETVKPSEIDRFRVQLADEIDRCVASKLVPTDAWSSARNDID